MKIETVDINSLAFDPANVRKHGTRNMDAIKGSLRKFGQQKPIVVDAKGIVLAGNGTLRAARELGWTEIRIVRTELTGVEATAFAIADNRTAELAEWEEDKLGEVLRSLQDSSFDLTEIGYSESDFESLLSPKLSNDYTHKVDAPVYEPKGEKPPVVQLFDSTRADELLQKIQDSKVPDEVKRFLKTAAARHIIFDYGKIAEFYCHADKETQTLMEDSALVIIDFNKAMQLGYVKLKAEIVSTLENEKHDGAEDEADE
jgi:hypothetical protein